MRFGLPQLELVVAANELSVAVDNCEHRSRQSYEICKSCFVMRLKARGDTQPKGSQYFLRYAGLLNTVCAVQTKA